MGHRGFQRLLIVAACHRVCSFALIACVLFGGQVINPLAAGAVTPNVAPIANPDAYTTTSDIPVVPLTVAAPGVLANDYGSTLTAIKVTDPSHGAVTLNADGAFSYTPTSGFNGTDSFVYKVNNGHVDSAAATVTVTVAHVNQPPTITKPGAQTTSQGVALVFSATNSTAITVADPDAGTAAIKLTLTVAHGIVTATNTVGGAVTITGSGTGSVTLTGPQANVATALDGVTYRPSATYTGPDTVLIHADDQGNTGSGGARTADASVAITVVSNSPVLTAGGTLAYTEGQAATPVDPTVTVADPVRTTLVGATVAISANYQSGQDVLSFTNTANITGTFNAATGVLTLTGTDTLANYQTALRSVTYQNISQNPSTAPRTVAWVGNDGTATSAPVTSTITVTAVNNPPVLTAGGTLAYTEGQAATPIDPTVTVADVDSTNLASATVSLSANYQSGADVLAFANTANVTGSFNAATGALTLTGSDTLANYQAALRAVTYQNTSQNPATAPRTVMWIANDGSAANDLSAPVTSTITVTAVNNPPVLTAGGTFTYTEGDPAAAIDPTVTVADPDNTNLASATVQITGNYQSGQDVLAFANTANITGTFNAANGTLTLTGSDTVANYQAALRAVTYRNTSQNPATASRTVTWVGNDGSAVNNLSAPVTSTITVIAVNNAPVLTAGGTLTYTAGQAATPIDPTVTVADVDNANLASATVQITGNYQSGDDVLSFVNTANITGTFDVATGTLTLTGSDTLGNYQTALRSVAYNTTSQNPSTATRTVTWIGNDGSATNNLSAPVTSTIIVKVNQPPVVTLSGAHTLAYMENQAATAIDAALSVTDPDSTNLVGATIAISANYQSGQDVLSFANTANITGTFNVGTGTLTLTGSDTVANYQTALRSVKYQNTSQHPATASRTVTWIANDGGPTNNFSAPVTSTITVTLVNDPPVAQAQRYSAQGSIQIAIPAGSGLLTGATDPDTGDAGFTAVFTVGSVNGVTPSGGTITTAIANVGTVVATASDGSFTFDPLPGVTGNVTFNYTICDNGNPLPAQCSAAATVTFNVAGPALLFVDGTNGSDSGTGTLSQPLKTLSKATTVDATNYRIFLYSGTYANSITLKSGEGLIGQGVTGPSFDSVLGITPPAGTIARPNINGTRPVVQGTVTMATNGVVRGSNITPIGGGLQGLVASNATGLTVGEVSVDTTATAGTAVNLTNADGTFSFTKISSNGGANGIVWNNATATTGSFTITGTGSTAGSGGTIQNTTGADGTTAGIGIYLQNAHGVSLSDMQINDHQNFAVFGSTVSGFTMQNSVVNGTNGTNGAGPYYESSVWFSQLTGVATLSGDTISGGRLDNVHVQNSSGTLSNLTITGPNCAIQNNSTSNDGNTGITILASLTANITTTISNCQFQGNRTDTIHTDAADTSTLNVTINGNTIVAGTGGNNQGNLGIDVSSSASAGVTFAVTNNKVGTPDDGTTKQPLINTGISIFRGSNAGVSSGTVTGNIVIQDPASANAGSGIIVNHAPTATNSTSALYAKVDGNTVGGSESNYGIQIDSGGIQNATGNTQVQLTNNVVATGTAKVPAQGAGALDAIRVGARRNTTACYRISGNTASSAGAGFFGFFLRNDATGAMSIEGLTPGAQNETAAIAYITSHDTIANPPGVGADTHTYTGVANGSCTNIPA